MSSKFKKLLSLLLVFVLVFQMVPATAFADDSIIVAEGSAPTLEERPDPLDSIYYQGVSTEYTASDVLWEIEEKRTETEKHFRLANGSDIAVAYTFPVHYEDEQGELQEIDNSLQLYNADGTLSAEPVESGLTAEVNLDTSFISSLIEGTGLEVMEAVTESPEPSPIVIPSPEPSAEPATEPAADEVLPEQDDGSGEEAVEAESMEILPDADFSLSTLSASIDIPAEAGALGQEAEPILPADESETAAPDEETADEAVEPTPTETPEAQVSEEPVLPEPTQTPMPELSIDDAQLQDMELSAVLEALPIDTRVYKNNAGLADVQLAVSAGAGQLASISYGDYTVSLTPRISVTQRSVSAIADQAISLASVAGRVQAVEPVVDEDSFAARVLPDNLSSSLVYDGILNGSDLEYVIGETSLKENIIVNEPAGSYVYSFTLETGGLTPTLTEIGSIELKTASGDTIFVIPAGYMIDADGVSSMDVEYSLETVSGSEYILTVTADADWMNDDSRAFPVTIDPPVYLQGFYNIETGTIFQYNPDAHGGQRATEDLGYYSANNGYCRTLVRVNSLPAIPDNSYVVNSGIYLYEVAYSHVGMNPMRVQAQALSWNYPTEGYWCLYHSWNDTPDPLPEVLDFTDVYNARNFYGWNITKEVIKWYNDPNTNYGISLQATKEGSMNYASCANVGFASSNTSNDAARPFFVVEYRNNVGLESYYTYQTQSIGRAGTGYVGDYSGQLTLVKTDLSSASTSNPVSISHIYNSSYSGGEFRDVVNGAAGKFTSFDVGKGWMLDFMQFITPSDSYLLYLDGDGTAHYFYSSDGVYKDEDGLGLTITVSGSNYTLTDKKDNIMYFAGGRLNYIQDANGNKITYNTDNSGAPTSVTRQNSGGSTETIATFQYNGSGQLYKIIDSANNATTFSYSNGYLTAVTHPDGTTVTYTYGSDGKLASATDDESDYAIFYEYDANTGKVDLFYEKGSGTTGATVQADGSFGGIQTYRYSGPDRVIGNSDDTISHHVLDYFGRTTSSYTTDTSGSLIYGANSTAYTLNSGVSATNNRALISTSTGTQSVNLLGYPSIEGTSNMASTPWSFSGGGTGAILFSKPRSGTRSMTVVRSAGQSDSFFSQTLTGLDPNRWYVLSGYVNTGSVTDFGSGKITMTANGAQTGVEGTSVNWNTSGVGDGWERIYVAAQPSASGSLTLSVKISGVVGTVYLDDFQAELSLFGERGTPGTASLLTNGSMSDSSGWGSWLSSNVSYVNDDTFGRVLRLQGDSFESIDVYQDVYTVLPGSQTYMLSGWAKADAVPLEGSGHRSFSFWVELYYGDEDGTTETHSIECNVDSDQWQFVSLPIVPEHPDLPVNAIRVYLTFCRNPNTALFANISLTREDAQSYKYNSDGELISVTSSETEPESFSYSGADLISQVTKGNGTLTYEYDDSHNPTKVTNDGLSMSAAYDAKGNTTGTTLTGEGSSDKINSSAAYDSTGNLLISQTDARGKSVTYEYGDAMSKQTGQPTSVTDAKGTETTNTYNSTNGRVISSAIGSSPSVSYTYADGQIASMSRSAAGGDQTVTQTYAMSYDNFGNMVSVNVGSRNLATYSYGDANGNLSELLYANGDSVSYEYDELERVSDVYYNDDVQDPAVSYSYSSNGALSRVDDYASGRDYVYNYDALGRLTSMAERYGSYGVQIYRSAFDGANRVSSVDYRVSPAWNGAFRDVRTYSYTYDDGNGSLSSMGLPANGTYTYSYDALQRLTGRTLKLGDSNFLTRSYSFVPGTGTDGTTMMVASLTTAKGDGSSLNSYSYTYDDVGNITAISGSTQAQYTYDDLGQMLTETLGDITYTYTYDDGGNILTASDGSSSHTYTYGDAQWKDLLTAYDGHAITYDAIGNPTSWHDGTTFTWDLGRRLMSAENTASGLDNSYTYDSDGLRLTKTVGDVQHKYVWQGSRLVSENWAGQELEFFYDESGSPYAFSYKASATATPVMYYYVTNLQGDVVNILDASGNIKASYTYNAWGEILSATGDMADINPLRYRGYYFDSDTGLYYLKARYYDPQLCRFINSDELTSTGQGVTGTNMFAYCGNNPVFREDSEGGFWVTAGLMAAGGLIGSAISAVSSAVTQYAITGTVNWKSVGVAAASGFVSGAIAASPLGLFGQQVAGGVIGGLSYAADCYVNDKAMKLDEAIVAVGAGVFSAKIGGAGANQKMALTNVYDSTRNTIAREARRANQTYAQKAVASALSYRNNTVANAAWASGFRFAAGTEVSNIFNIGYSHYSRFNTPSWKPW